MFQRVCEMASGSLCLSLLKPSRLLGRMKDRLSQQTREAGVTAGKGIQSRKAKTDLISPEQLHRRGMSQLMQDDIGNRADKQHAKTREIREKPL